MASPNVYTITIIIHAFYVLRLVYAFQTAKEKLPPNKVLLAWTSYRRTTFQVYFLNKTPNFPLIHCSKYCYPAYYAETTSVINGPWAYMDGRWEGLAVLFTRWFCLKEWSLFQIALSLFWALLIPSFVKTTVGGQIRSTFIFVYTTNFSPNSWIQSAADGRFWFFPKRSFFKYNRIPLHLTGADRIYSFNFC